MTTAMKKVIIPLAPEFEEIETITVVDILRRSGVRVSIAGTITIKVYVQRQKMRIKQLQR